MEKNASSLLFLMLSLLTVTILSSKANIISTAQPTPGIIDNELIGNSWSGKARIPEGGEIFGAEAVNGKVYAFGAYTYQGHTYNRTVYFTSGEYNPATDTWATKKVMRLPRINFATAVFENKIYVIGGQLDPYSPALDTVEVYDPLSDSWAFLASMPEPRMFMRANVVNGKIYVVGGYTNQANAALYQGLTNTTQVYDPKANVWSTAADIPDAIGIYASTVLDNKIYIFGGFGVFTTQVSMGGYWFEVLVSNRTYIYDPSTDVWTFGEPLPQSVKKAAACATTGEMAPKGIYVFGGYNDRGQNFQLTQVFNPTSNTWINGTTIPGHPLGGVAAVALNDIMYCMGGQYSTQNDDFGSSFSEPDLGAPPFDSYNYQYVPFGYGTFEPIPTVTPLVTPSQVGSGGSVLLILAVAVLVLGVLIAGLVLNRRRSQR
jgi:N-acetylneuraminic acid mutarotase